MVSIVQFSVLLRSCTRAWVQWCCKKSVQKMPCCAFDSCTKLANCYQSRCHIMHTIEHRNKYIIGECEKAKTLQEWTMNKQHFVDHHTNTNARVLIELNTFRWDERIIKKTICTLLALKISAQYGSLKCMELLVIKYGVDVNARDDSQNTPLMLTLPWKHGWYRVSVAAK